MEPNTLLEDILEVPELFSKNEREIAKLYESYLLAWNHRDAKALVELCQFDAWLIGFDGSQHIGVENIESELSAIFRQYPTGAYVAKIESIRMISHHAAILVAMAGLVPTSGFELNPGVTALQTLVAVNTDGTWKLAQLQNTPAAFHVRADLREKANSELAQVVTRAQAAAKAKLKKEQMT